jgi:ABC-2 type transport system permease protein
MSGALYREELRQYRTSFLVWSLTIMALIAVTMAAMPTMFAKTALISSFLDAYPAGFMRAFSFDPSSFSNPLGFYVVYATLYVALLGSIFSISVSAGILHKEQSMRTAEFLLAAPLTRTQVALTKIAAYLTLTTALNALSTSAAWVCLAVFSPVPFSSTGLLVMSFYNWLLALGMGGMGLLVSLVVRRTRSLTGPATGIVLGFYLWDAIAKITEKYEAYGWASPFKWMDTKVTAPGYGLSWWRVALFAGLILGCFATSVAVYRRKDILA